MQEQAITEYLKNLTVSKEFPQIVNFPLAVTYRTISK